MHNHDDRLFPQPFCFTLDSRLMYGKEKYKTTENFFYCVFFVCFILPTEHDKYFFYIHNVFMYQ